MVNTEEMLAIAIKIVMTVITNSSKGLCEN